MDPLVQFAQIENPEAGDVSIPATVLADVRGYVQRWFLCMSQHSVEQLCQTLVRQNPEAFRDRILAQWMGLTEYVLNLPCPVGVDELQHRQDKEYLEKDVTLLSHRLIALYQKHRSDLYMHSLLNPQQALVQNLPSLEMMMNQWDADKEAHMNNGDSKVLSLINHFLTIAAKEGVRREGQYVVYPRFTHPPLQGYFTYYYERRKIDTMREDSDYVTIEDYIWRCADHFLGNSSLHKWLNENGMFNKVVRMMTKGQDPRFPDNQLHRDQLSFQDGLFDLERLEIIPYELPPALPLNDGCVYRKAAAGKHPTRSSYHYLDLPLPTVALHHSLHHHPPLQGRMMGSQISTPAFERILVAQGFSPEVRDWFYILFGRSFYETNRYDKWQVSFRLWGRGGTGKTTLTNFFQDCFADGQIGNMHTKARANFPLQAYAGARAIVGTDIGADWDLEPTYFNAIVSGDKVQVYKMYDGDGRNQQWKASLIWTGNEPPLNFRNSGDAQSRRVVHGEFTRPVERDPGLTQCLEQERAYWIVKCCLMYRFKARELQEKGVEDLYAKGVQGALPDYFHQQRKQFEEVLAPVKTLFFSLFTTRIPLTDADQNPTQKIQEMIQRMEEQRKQYRIRGHIQIHEVEKILEEAGAQRNGESWSPVKLLAAEE